MVQLDEETIMKAELYELYKLLRQRIYDDIPNEKELKEAIRQIRYGIDLEFDIHDYEIGNYTEKGKAGYIIIPDYPPKKKYSIPDIHTEIEKREDLARKTLLDSIEDDDLIKPRK